MTKPVYEAVLLSSILAVPLVFGACHKKSGGSSEGEQPAATATSSASAQPSADNSDDDDDSDASDNTAEGGTPKKRHAKKDKPNNPNGPNEPTEPAKFVINKPTPEPMAAPALRHPPALPAMPNFPEKGKYAKAEEVPKAGDTEACGQVWTGHEYQPVECIDPEAHTHHPKAAKVVVAYDKMKQPQE